MRKKIKKTKKFSYKTDITKGLVRASRIKIFLHYRGSIEFMSACPSPFSRLNSCDRKTVVFFFSPQVVVEQNQQFSEAGAKRQPRHEYQFSLWLAQRPPQQFPHQPIYCDTFSEIS